MKITYSKKGLRHTFFIYNISISALINDRFTTAHINLVALRVGIKSDKDRGPPPTQQPVRDTRPTVADRRISHPANNVLDSLVPKRENITDGKHAIP